MGALSDAAKDFMLDSLLQSPREVWAKLHTGDPGVDGLANPSGNSSRRQCLLAVASGGISTTTNELRWNSVPVAETLSWVSFWDDETAGTFLGRDDLPVAKNVNIGDNFFIAAGDVDVSV